MQNEILALMEKIPASSGGWFVFLTPTDEKRRESARILSAVLPVQAKFGGRTAVLPKGVFVTLASAEDPVFLPDDAKFTLMLLGWTSKDDAAKMQAWHKKSSSTL